MHLLVTPKGWVCGVREKVPDHRVFVAQDTEEAWVWQARSARREPLGIEHPGYAISPEGFATLMDETERVQLPVPEGLEDWEHELGERCSFAYRLGPEGMRFVRCATDFREFLNVWHALDQDTGKWCLLGEVLWASQETFVQRVKEHLWIYFLKNRQIGYTSIEIAYDAWVMRFRSANARVHLVSRTETLAKTSLLKPLKFGLRRLPSVMLLDASQDTTTIYELDAGRDDRRLAQAYAAKEPGRGETCSHLHLDEWAAMSETAPELPKDVWAAAEPTISKRDGSCHILCTGVGPVGYYADVWHQCVKGLGQLFASFVPATGARPDYTAEFLADKKRRMADDTRFDHEYPERWEDALSGGEGLRFRSVDVDFAAEYATGFQPPGTWEDAQGRSRRRRYVKAWDIAGPGERSDAVVGIVVDVTRGVWQVVAMVYNHGEDYPVTAQRIRGLHALYPGPTVIEDNEAGAAVRAFLDLPDDEVFGQRVTRQSKPVMVEELAVALGYQTIKWSPTDCPVLDAEVRGYRIPDDNIEQDTVMALCHALYFVTHDDYSRDEGGRVGRVFLV